jgi:hypothetical protein
MAAYTVRTGDLRGALVTPQAVSPALAELVGRIQRAPWPQWLEPGVRMRREVAELCRLQAARGLTVLSWLAEGSAPGDIEWLLNTHRLTGPRQRRADLHLPPGAGPAEVGDEAVDQQAPEM